MSDQAQAGDGDNVELGLCPQCGQRCDTEVCWCTCIQRPTVPLGRVLDTSGLDTSSRENER